MMKYKKSSTIVKWSPDQDKKVYRRVIIGIGSTLTLYGIYLALVFLLFSGCKKEHCYTCLAFSDNGTILRDTDYLCGEGVKNAYYETWEQNSGFADASVQCYEE